MLKTVCLYTWWQGRWQVGKPQPKSVPAARDSQTRRLSGSAFSSQENRNFVLLFLGSNIFPWIGSLICNLTSFYLRVGWRYQNVGSNKNQAGHLTAGRWESLREFSTLAQNRVSEGKTQRRVRHSFPAWNTTCSKKNLSSWWHIWVRTLVQVKLTR